MTLTVVASLFAATNGLAQGFMRTMQGPQSARFIEPPRNLLQQLREAEKSIADGRYSDAVVRLGDLLQQNTDAISDADGLGQDYFLDADEFDPSDPIVGESLLHRARRLIGELPSEGFEIYELRYGALARKTLDEAALGRDWEAVMTVRRQYFHTSAGYEASMLLAQKEWLAGRPLAAFVLLKDLVVSSAARKQLGKSLDVLYLASAHASGQTLESFEGLGGGSLTIGGVSTNVPDAASLQTWISDRFAVQPRSSFATNRDYRLLGGDANRNGGSDGEMPLANPRWRVETTASPRQEKSLKQRHDEMATRGELPPPSSVPLKVGDQLLMRTTERLVGVDFQTGKRVWQYPWYSASEGLDEEEESFDAIPGDEGSGDYLSQRVWNDLPFGQMSSDGNRVYVLDDLGAVEMASFSPIIGIQGTRPADSGRNTLVALDLATEGKLLWRIGAGEDQASSLTEAFFLGPPLPLQGRLYVLIEVAGDVCLSCLDPASGNEIWRQQLVAIETGGIDIDPVRRVGGAMPTYQDGLLICPTGAGAIVAIDLADRMLRWGRNYHRNIEQNNSLFSGNGLDQTQLMQRWYAGAAVAVDDTILLTPIESDRLFALDLLTGKMRFPEQSRIRMRYVAGVRDGRYLIIGSNQVRAFDVRTGEQLWTTAPDWIAAGQQVSGLGVFDGDSYLVPTTANVLVRISLSDGQVLEKRTTKFPLGNLVASGGEIISQSPTTLSVAFGERSLAPVVDKMLSKNPDDFEAIVRKAELLIQEGDRGEALEYLARAREMDPENDEVYILSVSAMLGSLRESPQLHGPLVDLLEKLIDRPSQMVELQSLRVQAGLEAKAWVETTQILVKLSELLRTESLVEPIDIAAMTDSQRQCILDSWIGARMQQIYKQANEQQRDTIDSMVAETLATHIDASPNVHQRILRHFGAVKSVVALRQRYGQRMVDAGRFLQAERASLVHLPWSTEALSTLSNTDLITLGNASFEGGFRKNAVSAYEAIDFEQLVNQAPEIATELSARREQILATADTQWSEQVTLKWDSAQRIGPHTMSAFAQRVAQTVVTGGPQFQHWKLVSEFQNPVAFRDPLGQLRGVPLDGINRRDEGDKEAIINGGLAMVVTSTELICVDLYELMQGEGEAVLWRRDWSGDSGPIAARRSETMPLDDQVYRYRMRLAPDSASLAEFRVGPILADRVLMLQGGDLIALDVFTSEPLWRNSTAPRSGVVLSDGERVAVVSPEANEVALFDAFDGAKLESRPWVHGDVWASQNRFVLAYDRATVDRATTIRLVDVFEDKVIDEFKSSVASRGAEGIEAAFGRIVDGRYMAVLNTEGKLRLWDLREGQPVGECSLPAMPDLQALHAIQLDGQIVILPRRKGAPTEGPLGRETFTDVGQTHKSTLGVYAVSLEDASLRWSYNDDTSWGCTLHQPADTPLLMLTRGSSEHNPTGPRKRELDVLAIDVNDGSVKDKLIGKQVPPQTNDLETRLVAQPAIGQLVVQIGGELLTYKFGGNPASDEETEE